MYYHWLVWVTKDKELDVCKLHLLKRPYIPMPPNLYACVVLAGNEDEAIERAKLGYSFRLGHSEWQSFIPSSVYHMLGLECA